MNIAIIGLGNIGSYLFKYLNDNKKILTEKNNSIPIITYVSAKNKNRKRSINIKKSQWLNNYLDATKHKNVDLIIEENTGAVKILEIGARVGATCLHELVSIHTGIDWAVQTIRAALGEEVRIDPLCAKSVAAEIEMGLNFSGA